MSIYPHTHTHTPTRHQIGFVATNSITQGEQVGQLWPLLLEKYEVEISFAYKSFKWDSEAKGKAQVTVVIIGFGRDSNQKRLFYNMDDSIVEKNPNYISPYLIGCENKLPMVKEASRTINGLPNSGVGSQPIDGGNYIFTDQQKEEFLRNEPDAESYIVPYVSSKDFINGTKRWILALHNITPNLLKNLPETTKRVSAVKKFRSRSTRSVTKELAKTPLIYAHNIIPNAPFLLIPRVSSENREYIPIAYVQPPSIPSDSTTIIQNARIELFGLITSKMHMLWLDNVGGKLETRLRYSAGMVYNTFPVPKTGYELLEKYAQKILDVRKKYSDSSLSDLYDPITMPPDLLKAHQSLDRVVEKLYRNKPFESDDERIEFLLEEYQKMVSKQNTL